MPHPVRSRDGPQSTSFKWIHGLNLVGLEKRYRPTKHYVYVINVLWSDNSTQVIYRKYSEFFEFHMTLMDIFPEESDQSDTRSRIIPFLPGYNDIILGKKVFRSEVRNVASKRKTTLADYCSALVILDGRISQHSHVIKFFESRALDISPSTEARTKPARSSIFKALVKRPLSGARKKGHASQDLEEADNLSISEPISLEKYRAVAGYVAIDKSEVSFKEDELVDIIEKNDNGWWFIQIDERQGWAPASYLMPDDSDIESDEPLPLCNYEQHLVIEDYTAELNDEITMKKGAIVNVMHKLLDGWWIVHHNSKVGYAPATYLVAFTPRVPGTTSVNLNSMTGSQGELQSTITDHAPSQPATRDGSAKKPAKRRCTIKRLSDKKMPQSNRDLITYRKMSVKMQQRQAAQFQQKAMLPLPPDQLTNDDGTYLQPHDVNNADETQKAEMSKALGISRVVPPPIQLHTEDTLDYENVDVEDETHDYTNLSDGDENGSQQTPQSHEDDDDDDESYVNIEQHQKIRMKTSIFPPSPTDTNLPETMASDAKYSDSNSANTSHSDTIITDKTPPPIPTKQRDMTPTRPYRSQGSDSIVKISDNPFVRDITKTPIVLPKKDISNTTNGSRRLNLNQVPIENNVNGNKTMHTIGPAGSGQKGLASRIAQFNH